MSSRKNPPDHGMFCRSSRTRYSGPCYDVADWVIYAADKETGELITDFACPVHLHKVLAKLTPTAGFSREMFRVIPAQMVADWASKHEVGRAR